MTKKQLKPKINYKQIIVIALFVILALLLATGIYQQVKPLPQGINYVSDIYYVQAELLVDITAQKNNETIIEQEIFTHIFTKTENAESYILTDMFLFNNFLSEDPYQNLSSELIHKLIASDAQVDVITDPLNILYGGYDNPQFHEIDTKENLIFTNLKALRDSNPFYSTPYRVFLQWFSNSENGWITSPLHDGKVTARTFLELLNFKANHRKVFMSDWNHSVIASANPHDGSSRHSNIGVAITSTSFARAIHETESGVAKMSGGELQQVVVKKESGLNNTVNAQLFTEQAIKKELLSLIKQTTQKESIDIGMFYLSDRAIIKELKKAGKRGVEIRLILDANKDAFGREKNGIPNRPVANELSPYASIRWYNTNGEQFHSKFIIITKENGESILFLGSANWTKRNLEYNGELNVKLWGDAEIFEKVNVYFNTMWHNTDGTYTLDFETYKDESLFRYWLYRFQEWSGLSSF